MKKILFLLLFISNLIIAQNDNPFDIARKGSLSEIKSLFEKNPKAINSLDERGSSMLILACYRGNHEVAKFLIENVLDINYISTNGTALMACVVKGELDLLDSLIKKNADVNLTDPNGQTALMLAVQFKNATIVKKLLEANADKTIKCKQNKTAFEYAVFSGNEEIIKLLK